ncbi:MAG: prolyl oligopeptidase family serine peptidase, partial [Chloroflexi bacterium]|nr:prolyl oligopeptidase family serine peptidase [Chloroflexota bacterium]
MTGIEHLYRKHFAIFYNIDGCSLVYDAKFNEDELSFKIKHMVVGDLPLENGELEHLDYNKEMDIFTVSFSTAVSPTQIYSIEKKKRDFVVLHTNEKVLGIPQERLSKGEDASFTSFDGLRISARLYLPSAELGFKAPRPVVYYIHGGPQGQERPNFAWFSMALIQYLTLRGFAVFVPNVRGSTGYGLSYTKHVDRDWGGQDRLDHVHALQVLASDARLDVTRAGVVGRSYGG